MIKLITNNYNLQECDMTEVVKRVKVLIINSKDEVLLANSYNDYQFPGGHVEEGEELSDTVVREIQEETGIIITKDEVNDAFALKEGYYKDWPEPGKNRKIEIYYYEIKTDKLPDKSNTNFTESEAIGNFNVVYIPLDEVEDVLNKNIDLYGDKKGIQHEMLDLVKVYKKEK